MSFKKLAERGIGQINKANQHHQMPLLALNFMPLDKENTVYSVSFSNDRAEHLEYIKQLAMKIPVNSKVNIQTQDPFITVNLANEFSNNSKVVINDMKMDLDAGNPIFYERSDSAMDSRSGSKLVYDAHIMNAVKNLSGRCKERGPYITDTTWFQGGAKQGKFRDWLFGPEFGLKTIVLLPSSEFDVDADKTQLVMFMGEQGYDREITLIDYETKKEFTADFRKLGYVVKNEKLANLLPSIKTKSNYDWKRSKVSLKLNTKTGEILEGPKEIKNGDIPVLKKMLLNKEPEIYYTTKDQITDWTDVDKTRFVTGYNAGGTHADYYKILKGFIAPPGMVIPGDMWFTYTVIDDKDKDLHKKHLLSYEVQQILKATRTGKSLHTPQTIWIPYATEFNGWTDEQREILNEL
jgi:hypothetical protein